MRKPLLILFLALLVIGCKESLEERAERDARVFTERNCPTPVVNNSRTDSVAFDKVTKTYTYYCSLVGEYDNEEFIDTFKNDLDKQLVESISDDTSITKLKEAGFNFKFIIRSDSNPEKTLYEKIITAEEYNNPLVRIL